MLNVYEVRKCNVKGFGNLKGVRRQIDILKSLKANQQQATVNRYRYKIYLQHAKLILTQKHGSIRLVDRVTLMLTISSQITFLIEKNTKKNPLIKLT